MSLSTQNPTLNENEQDIHQRTSYARVVNPKTGKEEAMAIGGGSDMTETNKVQKPKEMVGKFTPEQIEARRERFGIKPDEKNTISIAEFALLLDLDGAEARYNKKKAAEQEHHSATPQQGSGSNSEKVKIIEEQKLLAAAGYGNILTRHGEKNGGIDGTRGGDTKAAEEQFRKDHLLLPGEDMGEALAAAAALKSGGVKYAHSDDVHAPPSNGSTKGKATQGREV